MDITNFSSTYSYLSPKTVQVFLFDGKYFYSVEECVTYQINHIDNPTKDDINTFWFLAFKAKFNSSKELRVKLAETRGKDIKFIQNNNLYGKILMNLRNAFISNNCSVL